MCLITVWRSHLKCHIKTQCSVNGKCWQCPACIVLNWELLSHWLWVYLIVRIHRFWFITLDGEYCNPLMKMSCTVHKWCLLSSSTALLFFSEIPLFLHCLTHCDVYFKLKLLNYWGILVSMRGVTIEMHRAGMRCSWGKEKIVHLNLLG